MAKSLRVCMCLMKYDRVREKIHLRRRDGENHEDFPSVLILNSWRIELRNKKEKRKFQRRNFQGNF